MTSYVDNGTDNPNAKRRKLEVPSYVALTTHPTNQSEEVKLNWGAKSPKERRPVIGQQQGAVPRNTIGAHGGSYSIYKALAVATGSLDPHYIPNLHNTEPPFEIPPNPSWYGDDTYKTIMSMDPWGHIIKDAFADELKKGIDIRPTIAVTKAHIDVPEIIDFVRKGEMKPDGEILHENGKISVGKAAIDPVWYLPGLAKRFGVTVAELRQHLFQHTNGMFPELLTRTDLDVFLPPVGGMTAYVFGDVEAIADPDRKVAVRVHDECNGSDVFGSDICTCRPYLVHGIEMCIRMAQAGGVGIIVYFRKEGRALGEVTKYLVYNARKRQEGGDKAEEYFNCTANVAGIEDARFQSLMPDALLWLGVKKIDQLMSMSDMKYNAIVSAGIEVVDRIAIPTDRVPADAQVEISAKVFHGYNGGGVYKVTEEDLKKVKGRGEKSQRSWRRRKQ